MYILWCIKDPATSLFIVDYTTGHTTGDLSKAAKLVCDTDTADEDTYTDFGANIETLIVSSCKSDWNIEVWDGEYITRYAKIRFEFGKVSLEHEPKTPKPLLEHIEQAMRRYIVDYILAGVAKVAWRASKGIAAPTVAGTEAITKATEGVSKLDDLIDSICKNTKADITKPKETLADYVCEDSLKSELEEIKDFFENEKKYTDLGIRIPKGVLFKGLPGTGKTFAARCIAGSVECYFMTCTASSLQGMYIGSGAENIKGVFKGAKELHRASGKGVIVFIDEIDSFGNRESHNGSTSGEEDRTLNQLLAEMSGFEDSEGIMVLAATNFPDRLDEALLRSGRFSRQITIDPPDSNARHNLCTHYFGKIKLPLKDTDCDDITQLTPGFTPADIQELANECGILALRAKKDYVGKEEVDEAINKTITKDIRKPDKTEMLEPVAIHECGHVLAEYLYNHKYSLKVTNYAYGDAGGFTQPNKENTGLISKAAYVAKIKMLLGGRVAEESRGLCTTGASDDLRRAKALIKNYYSVYHFDNFEPKDLDSTVQEKLVSLRNEIYKDFTEPDVSSALTALSLALCKNRILYSTEIAAIITKETER